MIAPTLNVSLLLSFFIYCFDVLGFLLLFFVDLLVVWFLVFFFGEKGFGFAIS